MHCSLQSSTQSHNSDDPLSSNQSNISHETATLSSPTPSTSQAFVALLSSTAPAQHIALATQANSPTQSIVAASPSKYSSFIHNLHDCLFHGILTVCFFSLDNNNSNQSNISHQAATPSSPNAAAATAPALANQAMTSLSPVQTQANATVSSIALSSSMCISVIHSRVWFFIQYICMICFLFQFSLDNNSSIQP